MTASADSPHPAIRAGPIGTRDAPPTTISAYLAVSLHSTVDATENDRLQICAQDFARIASGPDDDVDLGRAAILLGRIAEPTLDVERTLARLDGLAAQASGHLAEGSAADRAERLAAFLFNDLGFAGDQDDYYQPDNSYLHRVVERRRGLPITLSIVMIEVARRLELVVEGVGAPQHFIVRLPANFGPEPRLLDPFNGGCRVDTEELRAELDRSGAQGDSSLAAVTRRQILARVLNNLKAAGIRRGDGATALGATEHLVALTPWALEEIRDRGVLRAREGLTQRGLQDLTTYRDHVGKPPDLARVEAMIDRLSKSNSQDSASP
jgi:regulator of sirC expression with transglutaminase-like and TPR domain